jgi:hypothetical protein
VINHFICIITTTKPLVFFVKKYMNGSSPTI